MTNWFSNNSERASDLSFKWDDFFLDYSKNRLTTETISLLKELTEEIELSDSISKYFNGTKINQTEKRAVMQSLSYKVQEGCDLVAPHALWALQRLESKD